jgi:hypothetical protein
MNPPFLIRLMAVAVAATFPLALMNVAQASTLANPGFESPDASGGDVGGTDDWGTFNQVFTTAAVSRSGSQSLKTFGPFSPGGGTGAVQALPAAPGQTWVGEIWALNASFDPLDAVDFGVYKIEFLDAGFNLAAGGLAGVDVFESNQINGATPKDEWTLLGVGTAPAPANTAYAQAVLVKVDLDGTGGGSIFWDDASLVVPEPTSLALLGLAAMILVGFRRLRR